VNPDPEPQVADDDKNFFDEVGNDPLPTDKKQKKEPKHLTSYTLAVVDAQIESERQHNDFEWLSTLTLMYNSKKNNVRDWLVEHQKIDYKMHPSAFEYERKVHGDENKRQ